MGYNNYTVRYKCNGMKILQINLQRNHRHDAAKDGFFISYHSFSNYNKLYLEHNKTFVNSRILFIVIKVIVYNSIISL